MAAGLAWPGIDSCGTGAHEGRVKVSVRWWAGLEPEGALEDGGGRVGREGDGEESEDTSSCLWLKETFSCLCCFLLREK